MLLLLKLIPILKLAYRTVKTLANKDCRKLGGKNFGDLKSICIRNVMEIVKIGKKLSEML